MDWSEYCGCNRTIQGSCPSVFHFTALRDNDLSPCLQLLVQGVCSLLLLTTSITYLWNFCGYRDERVSRTSLRHYLTLFRCILCVFIACTTSVLFVIKTNEFTGSDVSSSTLYYSINAFTSLAWLITAAMLYAVRYVFPRFKRAPPLVVLIYLLNIVVLGKQFESYWVLPAEPYQQTIVLLYSMTALAHVFLITALIPSGLDYGQGAAVSVNADGEAEALLGDGSLSVSYSTFGRADPRHRLYGEDGNFLSQLIFWWVQPLMKRGKLALIQHGDDVFYVSLSLCVIYWHSKQY